METLPMRTPIRTHARRSGFSLLELLLVLVIISVLGGVAALNLQNQAAKARVTTTEQTLRTCSQAIESYYLDTGTYPTQEEWEQGALWPEYLKDAPTDAWDQPVWYFYPLNGSDPPFELRSLGPDGVADTQDDISTLTMGDETS